MTDKINQNILVGINKERLAEFDAVNGYGSRNQVIRKLMQEHVNLSKQTSE